MLNSHECPIIDNLRNLNCQSLHETFWQMHVYSASSSNWYNLHHLLASTSFLFELPPFESLFVVRIQVAERRHNPSLCLSILTQVFIERHFLYLNPLIWSDMWHFQMTILIVLKVIKVTQCSIAFDNKYSSCCLHVCSPSICQ